MVLKRLRGVPKDSHIIQQDWLTLKYLVASIWQVCNGFFFTEYRMRAIVWMRLSGRVCVCDCVWKYNCVWGRVYVCVCTCMYAFKAVGADVRLCLQVVGNVRGSRICTNINCWYGTKLGDWGEGYRMVVVHDDVYIATFTRLKEKQTDGPSAIL